MAKSWRQVATALAGRLVHHAFCETHSRANPDPDCPFCADREAYEAYVAAGGYDFRPSPYTGPVVSVHELAQRPWLDRSAGPEVNEP